VADKIGDAEGEDGGAEVGGIFEPFGGETRIAVGAEVTIGIRKHIVDVFYGDFSGVH
jgi:hypothetical protein